MRIVLSRLDRLGDFILSTPAIRTLRRSFPQAHLTLLCSPRNAVAAKHNPDLDEWLVADGWRDELHVASRFRDVDLAIALAPRTADFVFIAATRARKRLGYTYCRRYAAQLFARCCMTQLLISQADPELCERDPERPVLHEVDQLLALATAAGATELSSELVLPVTEADRAAVAGYPAGAIHLHLAPRWLARGSNEVSLCLLLAELRIWHKPLVVSYAPECQEVAERIARAAFADAVVGDLSFTQWAALMERSACVMTVDTSATHVASAMLRPTVVLFEHESFALNAREWAPWRVPQVVLRKPAHDHEAALRDSRQELVAAVGRLVYP